MKRLFLLGALLAAMQGSLAACDRLLNDDPELLAPLGVDKDEPHDDGSGDDDDGPDPTPTCPGGTRFALSESDSSSSIRLGDLRDGIVPVYLWKLEGTGVSALQGEFVVEGGALIPGSFSAVDPFMSVTLSDGPDVLMAVGGCPCEELLVGMFYVDAGPDGIRVRLVPGAGGGAVNCATNPVVVGFQCLEYSSR